MVRQGMVIWAVNLSEPADRVKSFMESNGFSFTVLLDVRQDTAQKYNVRGIPTTFFIDKDGIIRDIRIGALTGEAERTRRLSKIIP